MITSLRSFTLHSRTQEFCISHHITSRRQKGSVEINFERDKNLINNQSFLMDDPGKGYQVTTCIDVYREKSNLMEVLTI